MKIGKQLRFVLPQHSARAGWPDLVFVYFGCFYCRKGQKFGSFPRKKIIYLLILTKNGWSTFSAIFSQTHLVPLSTVTTHIKPLQTILEAAFESNLESLFLDEATKNTHKFSTSSIVKIVEGLSDAFYRSSWNWKKKLLWKTRAGKCSETERPIVKWWMPGGINVSC
jgi:hypothetical protein